MDTFHIYDKDLQRFEFYYFFGTHIEEESPWDPLSMYCGFLITTSGEILKTKIPISVYEKIPNILKRDPIENSRNRFYISSSGDIIYNFKDD